MRRTQSRFDSLPCTATFHPGPEALVFPGLDPANFRKREWRRICQRTQLGHRRLKDLRDTFASQLLTAGIGLKYISRQLGHSSVVTTERHYAKWVQEDDFYREPMQLLEGEVPADLLARLEPAEEIPLARLA